MTSSVVVHRRLEPQGSNPRPRRTLYKYMKKLILFLITIGVGLQAQKPTPITIVAKVSLASKFTTEIIPLASYPLTTTSITYTTLLPPVSGVLTWWYSGTLWPNGQPSSGPVSAKGQQLTINLPTSWTQTDSLEIVYQYQ